MPVEALAWGDFMRLALSKSSLASTVLIATQEMEPGYRMHAVAVPYAVRCTRSRPTADIIVQHKLI